MAVAAFGYGSAFTHPNGGGALDPTYATIKAISYGWTATNEYRNEVKTHQCTEEELGLSGDPNSHQFMKTNVEEIALVVVSKENFVCVDKQ